jgi:hypothetical protein
MMDVLPRGGMIPGRLSLITGRKRRLSFLLEIIFGGKFLVIILTCGVQLEGLCWGEEAWLIGLPALGVPFIGVVGFELPAHPPADPTPNPAVRFPIGTKKIILNFSCFTVQNF